MLNYLKWELKNYFGNKLKWFIAIGIVFALMMIIPFEGTGNVFTTLVILSYSIILLISVIGAYFAGTKHAVDTFSKKTFLLESMIPVPAKKILLCKYILGMIINFAYILIIAIGIAVVLIRGIGLENTFEAYKAILDKLNFETVLTIISTSIFFLSVVVLGFVGAKAINPGGKHDKITGFVFAFLLLYFTGYLIGQILTGNTNLYLANLVYIGISAVVFFITSYLIENKLEIYN